MSDNLIQCATHGENHEAFVCSHLVGDPAGLGFHRDEPTENVRFPDAWCDDCELIREAHGGWTDESHELLKISLICSRCYERARIRNTHTTVTLADLAGLRWKCGSCDEWHTGPCLDFGYDSPSYWDEERHGKANNLAKLLPKWVKKRRESFLHDDLCSIEDQNFFVRGIIQLPIIGTAETFNWGVWGSLSRENFEAVVKADLEPERTKLPIMFSWLSSQIPEYPDTLNIKMHAHVQKPGWRPHFELEATDHPLSQEYHNGITPERVREIMAARL